jgi:hypothetical protein
VNDSLTGLVEDIQAATSKLADALIAATLDAAGIDEADRREQIRKDVRLELGVDSRYTPPED